MIGLPAGTLIWLVAGMTDMRGGFNGLAARVQANLQESTYCGHVFLFRGRRGGIGLCLFAEHLEHGHVLWPKAADGVVCLTHAPLLMLLEGIDWRRRPLARNARPRICKPR